MSARFDIHFFDVDHTITSGSTGRRYAIAAIARGILKPRHLGLIPLNYVQYRLGGGGASLFDRELPAIRGIEREKLRLLAEEVFETSTKRAVRPALVRLIESLKAEGGRIVLATSSLDFIIEPLARSIGVDEVIASSLEFEDGVCTGRLARATFGGAKRDEARAYAASRGIALSSCSFYSDSIHDLPLLLEVGKPVAVDPDHRLRREARKRGWEILRSEKRRRGLDNT